MDDGVYASPMDYSLFGSLKCTGEERQLINCAITDVDCLPTCDTNAAIQCYSNEPSAISYCCLHVLMSL